MEKKIISKVSHEVYEETGSLEPIGAGDDVLHSIFFIVLQFSEQTGVSLDKIMGDGVNCFKDDNKKDTVANQLLHLKCAINDLGEAAMSIHGIVFGVDTTPDPNTSVLLNTVSSSLREKIEYNTRTCYDLLLVLNDVRQELA